MSELWEKIERDIEQGYLKLQKIAEESREEFEAKFKRVVENFDSQRASELRGAIKTLSDINESYLGELDTLETRNTELLEAVKKAHEILLHEMDNGRTPSMLQGGGLGYFEGVIAGIEAEANHTLILKFKGSWISLDKDDAIAIAKHFGLTTEDLK